MVNTREIYEPIARKTFETVLSHLFRTEFGFLGGPAVIELMVNRIKLLCDEYYPPLENFQFRVSPVFLRPRTLRKFADEKSMRLKHRLKKLSAVQEKSEDRKLGKKRNA